MELYHVNHGNPGFVKISVEVPNQDTRLNWQTYEVSKFWTSYINDPEIMEYTMEGATGGTFTLFIFRQN